MQRKYLGAFTLQYLISRCGVDLTLNQNLILESDECKFIERRSEGGKIDLTIAPSILTSYLLTENKEQVYMVVTQVSEIYHFYQEIWSFLLNYNYVTLKIIVENITTDYYIIKFKVFLSESAFSSFTEVKLSLPQIKKMNQEEQNQYREQMKRMIIHQHAKESFKILFEILNLNTTILAFINPQQSLKLLDDLIERSYQSLTYYQKDYLSKNRQIPLNLSKQQKKVTSEGLFQLQQKLLNYEKLSPVNNHNNQVTQPNLFSVNEESSAQFSKCKKPEDLVSNLFPYQAQAIQWMLYREQKIDAQTLNLPNEKLQLHKMWSEIQLYEDNYIYFNEFTGQFSNEIVLSRDVKGGILADQMGLGKSICSIALILLSKELKQQQEKEDEQLVKKVKSDKKRANTLIVVQLSILEHWKKEILKHTYKNKIEVYECYSQDQRRPNTQLDVYDIVITTYGILSKEYRSNGILYQHDWERIILDEAHTIKSKSAVCTIAASSISAQCRWCLTGTPIQNNLDDLFSLFHFLQVDTFSNYSWFNHYINKQEDLNQKFSLLHQILKPILLRRTKQTEAISKQLNLTDKQHIIFKVKLSTYEREFYNLLHRKTSDILKEFFGKERIKGKKDISYIHAFQILSSLRQCCDHAGLMANKYNIKVEDEISNKLKRSEWIIKKFIDNSASTLEKSLREQIKQISSEKNRQETEIDEGNYDNDDDESISGDETIESIPDQEAFDQQQEDIDDNNPIVLQQKLTQLDKIQEERNNPNSIEEKFCKMNERVNNDECSICLEKLKDRSTLYYLACGHIYCRCFEDLKKPNQESIVCPLCKKEISQQETLKLKNNNLQGKPVMQNQIETANYFENIKEKVNSIKESTKINHILNYVEYVKNKGEKVVIFTQWLKILNFIEGKLRVSQIEFRKIVGSMNKKQRSDSIEDFFQKNVTVILISLKAGAYGINLCCANHVILVDPWWNPAVEDQAIERVHRLGQKHNVKILSFICENTIEERVIELHKIKRKLFKDALHLKVPEQEFTFQDQLEYLFDNK